MYCIGKCCQFCLSKTKDLYDSNISNNNTTSYYEQVTEFIPSLKRFDSEDFPKKICSKCITTLNTMNQFKATCLKSQKLFIGYLEQLKSHIRITDDDRTQSTNSFKSPTPVKQELYMHEELLIDDTTDNIKIEQEEGTGGNPDEFANDVNSTTTVNYESGHYPFNCVNIKQEFNTDLCVSNSESDNTDSNAAAAADETNYEYGHCDNDMEENEEEQQHSNINESEQGLQLTSKIFGMAKIFVIDNKKHYICTICHETVYTIRQWGAHKKIHNIKPTCKFCGKQFTRYFTVRDHERIHTGEKPFECKLCKKTFRTSTQFRDHKLKKPFRYKVYDK